MISLILGWILTGLIVGALGRLAIPGPNPMSIGKTILIGIAGAFVGGIIAYALGLGVFGSYVVAVLVTAAIIYFLEKRNVARPL
ncbi:MAG: GlsB/YeaQ/YmgE family stress response membrane protein [Acidimicrobiia bacterium]